MWNILKCEAVVICVNLDLRETSPYWKFYSKENLFNVCSLATKYYNSTDDKFSRIAS